MPNHDLLTSQRNYVFLAVQEAGLNPLEFKWGKMMTQFKLDYKVPSLIHVLSGWYFCFDRSAKNNRYCIYSPGDEQTVDNCLVHSWEEQYRIVKIWLQYLLRELSTPDLWETIAGESAMVLGAPVGSSDNTMFTSQERERLSQSLLEIKEYLVATNSLTEDRLSLVEERLHYIEDAAGRIGRKDWINLAYGTLLNIVVGVALPPTAAHDLIRMAGCALAWVLNNIPVLSHSIE